jgi:hypothetical protein
MDYENIDHPRLDQAISDAALKEHEQEQRSLSYYPRVSNAGKCPRALTYRALGMEEKPLTAQKIQLFRDGDWHEHITANWLEKTDFKIVGTQTAVNVTEVPGGQEGTRKCQVCGEEIPLNMLHGHIDGIVAGQNNERFLWEHKGLNERGFKRLDEEYPAGYVAQCSCYVYGLRKAGDPVAGAILLIKSKHNSDYKQIFIAYDEETDEARVENEWNGRVWYVENVVQEVVNLHATVEEFRFGLDMPDRPYDYDDWQCQWCDFKEQCWTDHDIEIRQRKDGCSLAMGDPLAMDLERFHELRREKNGLELEIKELRRNILTGLADNNIKAGEMPGLKFGLSAMTKERVDLDQIPAEMKKAATKTILVRTIQTKEV